MEETLSQLGQSVIVVTCRCGMSRHMSQNCVPGRYDVSGNYKPSYEKPKYTVRGSRLKVFSSQTTEPVGWYLFILISSEGTSDLGPWGVTGILQGEREMEKSGKLPNNTTSPVLTTVRTLVQGYRTGFSLSLEL